MSYTILYENNKNKFIKNDNINSILNKHNNIFKFLFSYMVKRMIYFERMRKKLNFPK